jgi:hypothetical protein
MERIAQLDAEAFLREWELMVLKAAWTWSRKPGFKQLDMTEEDLRQEFRICLLRIVQKMNEGKLHLDPRTRTNYIVRSLSNKAISLWHASQREKAKTMSHVVDASKFGTGEGEDEDLIPLEELVSINASQETSVALQQVRKQMEPFERKVLDALLADPAIKAVLLAEMLKTTPKRVNLALYRIKETLRSHGWARKKPKFKVKSSCNNARTGSRERILRYMIQATEPQDYMQITQALNEELDSIRGNLSSLVQAGLLVATGKRKILPNHSRQVYTLHSEWKSRLSARMRVLLGLVDVLETARA